MMLLTLALLTSSTNTVFAADWYLEDGDITVSATNAGQTVTQGDTTTDDDEPVIQNRDPDTATEHTITVKTEGDASASLTIEDVHIFSDDAVIDVGSAHVVLQVSGENTLTSTEEAAIHVSDGSVTIEGDGSLTATSTADAAIGAGENEAMSGEIIIQGEVEVHAYGSEDSAAIGAEDVMDGSIEIRDTAEVITGVVDKDANVLEDEIGYVGAGSTSDHTHNEGSFFVEITATVNGVSGSDTDDILTYVNAYVNEDGEAVNLENCEHSYTAVVTEPTCDTECYTTYTCAHCGDSYTRNATSAFGHTYTATVTEPTCRYAGYTTYTCETCGSSYTDHYVDAVDCDYSVWTSCGEETWRHLKVCKYCGCREGEAENCTLVYVEFADTVYPLCTACGTMGNLVLDVAEDAECRMGETMLTEDDVLLYEKEEPFGWTYGNLEGYDESPLLVDRIFTVNRKAEDDSLTDPEGEMTITMAYTQRYGYGGYTLLRLLDDGTWMETASEYSVSDDTLTFKTSESDVFIVVY